MIGPVLIGRFPEKFSDQMRADLRKGSTSRKTPKFDSSQPVIRRHHARLKTKTRPLCEVGPFVKSAHKCAVSAAVFASHVQVVRSCL